MRKEESEQKLNKNIEELERQMFGKKKLPKEEQNKLNKKIFENILIANIIMAFLYFISIGSLNIETLIFITDLKVFSIMLVIFAIFLFEVSYKKQNIKLALHGIEVLILAIFILFCTYIYTVYLKNFHSYVASVSLLFAIYYIIKSIIIYRKSKKKYIDSLNDIEEIIKK